MSKKIQFKELLEAGVHFGHLKRKWNPAMAPYIFDEQKGIHVIDLNKTIAHLEQTCAALKQIAQSGKKILFVATKKQAKQIVEDKVKETNMPYVTERWTGGMLTNFATTRKSIRKMSSIDKMQTDGTWETLSKRERLFITRQREKLEKNFGSISEMTRQPAAIFIVDVMKENIALKEATRLGITTFAMVDTNSNPKSVDFIIPANDDASKSIAVIMDHIIAAVKEGLEERKTAKSQQEADKKKAETDKKEGAVAKDKKEDVKEAKETKEPIDTKEPKAKKATEVKEKEAPKAKTEKKSEAKTEKKAEKKVETKKKVETEKKTEKKVDTEKKAETKKKPEKKAEDKVKVQEKSDK